MSQILKRFINRAPRYHFQPEDDKHFRFSYNHHFIQSSDMVNISATGCAFYTQIENAPPIGAIIKVEIPVPGSKETIAWFARVMRLVEKQRPTWAPDHKVYRVLVGLAFQDLPDVHRHAIEMAVNKKWREIMRRRHLHFWITTRDFVARNFWRILFISACCISAVAMLYYLSQPDSNYDGQRGAPWGERFKSFKLNN